MQTSGNDVFYRNPRNIEENLFVDVSSPSSSKFSSVEDLGSPQEAAEQTLNQARRFLVINAGLAQTAKRHGMGWLGVQPWSDL
jgi:hypothetical protein